MLVFLFVKSSIHAVLFPFLLNSSLNAGSLAWCHQLLIVKRHILIVSARTLMVLTLDLFVLTQFSMRKSALKLIKMSCDFQVSYDALLAPQQIQKTILCTFLLVHLPTFGLSTQRGESIPSKPLRHQIWKYRSKQSRNLE